MKGDRSVQKVRNTSLHNLHSKAQGNQSLVNLPKNRKYIFSDVWDTKHSMTTHTRKLVYYNDLGISAYANAGIIV